LEEILTEDRKERALRTNHVAVVLLDLGVGGAGGKSGRGSCLTPEKEEENGRIANVRGMKACHPSKAESGKLK